MSVPHHFLALCALVLPATALANSEVLPSKVESVGIFKNGFVVVRETIEVPSPGTYHLGDYPKAIHGTLWFESEGTFEARLVHRSEERQVSLPRNLTHAASVLNGHGVDIELLDGKKLTGMLLPLPGNATPTSSPTVGPTPSAHSPLSSIRPLAPTPPSTGDLIALRETTGVTFIPSNHIRSITARGVGNLDDFTDTVTIPVLELDAAEAGTVTMTYLTEGMAWAPSYRIDYEAGGNARIGMSAIIRNEWRDMTDTRMELISGFPQIEYSAVTSPLWHEMALSSFFGQLSGLAHSSSFNGRGGIMSQMVMSNMASPTQGGFQDLAEGVSGPGEDLHFTDIGTRALARGSAISLQLGNASTPAVRFVDWRIGDDRDDHGRVQTSERDDEAWDSVRFNNPFDFPLTTAPASVWMDGKFRGQSTATFTNPGQEVVVKATKALSVETRHEEFDIERSDPRRVLHGDYQPVLIRSEMTVTNRRDTATIVDVTRDFQGTYRTSTPVTDKHRTTSRRNAVNPANQTKWTLELKPGEEKVIVLDYEVLVRI